MAKFWQFNGFMTICQSDTRMAEYSPKFNIRFWYKSGGHWLLSGEQSGKNEADARRRCRSYVEDCKILPLEGFGDLESLEYAKQTK